MIDKELRILYLLLEDDRFYSYRELAQFLCISDRSVRYVVDDLDYLFSTKGLNCLIREHGKGIKLDLDEQSKLTLTNQIPFFCNLETIDRTDRIIIMIFMIIDKSKSVYSKDFQEMFGASKSTIDADMRILRCECEVFNVKVISNNKTGLKIIGGEWEIRLMLNNYISQNVNVIGLLETSEKEYLTRKDLVVGSYLDRKFLSEVYALIKQSLLVDLINENDVYLAQLAICFSIWKTRVLDGNYIESTESMIKNYIRRHNQTVVDNFLSKIGMDEISSLERNYLDFMVDGLNLKKRGVYTQNWAECQLICVTLMEKMQSLRGIDYFSDDKLFENLMQHVYGIIKRIKEDIDIYNPLKDVIAEEYQDLYIDVKEATKIFSKGGNKSLSKAEVAYLCMHFCAFEERMKEKISSKYKVIVVCTHGLVTGQVLADRLKKRYQFDVIAILGSNEINTISKIRADFVLKTSHIEIEGIPSLMINPMPQLSDYEKIQKFIDENNGFARVDGLNISDKELFKEIYELARSTSVKLDEKLFKTNLKQIFSKYDINYDQEEVYQPMIKDILTDQFIRLNCEVSNWEDAIREVATPLLEEKYIESSYVDAMIETVYKFGPYIVIGENIALAHARPEDGVNKLGLSVCTLNPPIKFNHDDHDPVKIIFCLAAIDNVAHLKVMSSLVRLINAEGKIEELSKKNTLDEFKQYLFDLEN